LPLLPTGIEKFCKDIKLDPTDRKVLLLAWKVGVWVGSRFTHVRMPPGFCLFVEGEEIRGETEEQSSFRLKHFLPLPPCPPQMGAKRMGYFSREEFKSGLMSLGCSSLPQLKKALPGLEKAALAQAKPFYDFAFRFCLVEPGQKIVDVETAAQMLRLALPGGRFVDAFCEFLQVQEEYKKMNVDQWDSFYRFSAEVLPDMRNAGENPAWPVLIDNFVEWFRAR
jgi:hypothetical protein